MDEKDRVFEFLDELRESGATNMFGATRQIREEFDITHGDALALLREWMTTFSDRHPD